MSLEQEILGQFQTPEFEPVKAFNRELLCKSLTGREFGLLQKVCLEYGDNGDDKPRTNNEYLKSALTVLTLHDPESKKRIFDFQDYNEFRVKVILVSGLPEPELLKVYKVAAPLASLEDGALEDAEKNSETTPAKSGGTESPES